MSTIAFKLAESAFRLPNPLKSYAFAILLKLSSSLRRSYRQFQIGLEKERQNQFSKSLRSAQQRCLSDRLPLTQVFAAVQESSLQVSRVLKKEVQEIEIDKLADSQKSEAKEDGQFS